MARKNKRRPNDADLMAASYHLSTLPANDPLLNADLSDVATILMEVTEEIDRLIIVDHYDPKKRHYKIVPRNPWHRAEYRDIGMKLGQLLDSSVYEQYTPAPEVQRAYTQNQARGTPRTEYKKAGRHMTRA